MYSWVDNLKENYIYFRLQGSLMGYKKRDPQYNVELSRFHRGLIDAVIETGKYKTGSQFIRDAIRHYAKVVMEECA